MGRLYSQSIFTTAVLTTLCLSGKIFPTLPRGCWERTELPPTTITKSPTARLRSSLHHLGKSMIVSK